MVKYKLIFVLYSYLALPNLSDLQNISPPYDSTKENENMVMVRRELDKMTQELVSDKKHDIHLYHSYIFNSGIGNREELRVENISVNAQFVAGKGVVAWQTLKCAGQIYLLGRKTHSVSLISTSIPLSSNRSANFVENSIEIGENISCTTLFSRWNSTSSQEDVIVAIATVSSSSDIIWYKVSNNKMVLITKMVRYKQINDIAIVKVNGGYRLVIVDSASNAAVDMYNLIFSVNGTSIGFRLVDSLTLPSECIGLTVSGAGRQMYLAFLLPRVQSVHIYRLETAGAWHFVNHTTLHQPGVTQVVAFGLAHQWYLAINGDKPYVLRITETGEFVATLTLDDVSEWLAVPVISYRSDVVLFSRNAKQTNMFVWAGVKKGFKSMAIPQSDSSLEGLWSGAVSVPFRHEHCLLIPRISNTSNLISIITSLNEIESPVVKRAEAMKKSMKVLEEKLRALKSRLSRVENTLKHVVNKTGINVVTGNWKIDRIETRELHLHSVVKTKSQMNMTSENSTWNSDDLAELEQLVTDAVRDTTNLTEAVRVKENQVWGLENYTGKLTFNGSLTVDNLTLTKLNNGDVDDLLQNTFRRDRPNKIHGPVVVHSLKTENITFDKVKNVSSENIKFNDGPVIFNSNITFVSPVVIDGDLKLISGGKLNGMNLTEDICNHQPLCSVMPATSIEVRGENMNDELISPDNSQTWNTVLGGNNLTVLNINGVNLTELKNQVVYKDSYALINNTVKVKGTLTADRGILLDNFEKSHNPSDNERASNAESSEIIGSRQRVGGVQDINNIQDIFFTNLEVTGTVTADFSEWGLSASDLVFSDVERLQINSTKTFDSNIKITENLEVKGLVSGVNVSDLLTKDSHQKFHGDVKLKGHVSLGNVTLDGNLYEAHVSDFPNSEEDTLVAKEIIADDIRVLESLNDIPVSELVLTNRKNITFINELAAQHVYVTENIQVDGKVCNYDLKRFDQMRLSKSRDQVITGHFTINEASVANDFSIDFVNNQTINNFDDMKLEMSDGVLHLAELHVEGSIISELGVNGYNLSDLAANAIGLRSNNHIKGHLHFKDAVKFEFLECQGFFNNKLCQNWLDENDIIYNTEEPVILSGQMTFLEKLNILGDLEVEEINNHKVSDIFTKTTKQQISSDIYLTGDITLNEDSTVAGVLNSQNISDLANRCSISGRTIKCEGNAIFRNKVETEYFFTTNINDINFDKFYENLVNSRKTNLITGFKNFTAKSTKVNKLYTKKINGLNWNEFLLNVVTQNYIDQVSVPVTFTNLVIMDDLSVDNDLDAWRINSLDLNKWKTDAIYLNETFRLKRKLYLRSASSQGNLSIANYDGVNLHKDLIKLKGENSLKNHLRFESIEVTGHAQFDGTVNGNLLKELEESTMKTSGKQRVQSNLLMMGDIVVTGNVNITGLVNGLNLSNVVTLDTTQTLQGNYQFECIEALKNVSVSGLINDVNLTEWQETAVLQGRDQDVDGVWTIYGDVEFKAAVLGPGRLGNTNLAVLEQNITRDIIDVYQQIKGNLTTSCLDTNDHLAEARHSPADVHYIDVSQELSVPAGISMVTHFKSGDDNFLAVSENNCVTTIYKWNETNGQFYNLHSEAVGFRVSLLLVLLHNNYTYLLTEASDQPLDCHHAGRHLWLLTTGNLQHVSSIDYMEGHTLHQGNENSLFSMNGTGVYKWELELSNKTANFRIIDKWIVNTVGKTFVPPESRLGLAIQDPVEIVSLNSSVIMMPEMYTNCSGEILSISADPSRHFIAVATMERTHIPRHSDHVKVYQNGKSQLFDKLPAQKVSHIQWLQVPDQTWLVFLQNNTTIQFYHLEDYMRGFQLKISTNMEALSLTSVSLPLTSKINLQPYLIVKAHRSVKILQTILLGDPYLGPDLSCNYEYISLVPKN